MVPIERKCSFTLTYHVPGENTIEKVTLTENGVLQPLSRGKELGLNVRRTKHSWHLTVRPTKWVVIDTCEASLSIDLSHADSLFLNGYQSWTVCSEQSPRARTRGSEGLFFGGTTRSNFDSAGDTLFLEEDRRAGHQHGFTYGYLKMGDHTILVGSTDESNGYTLIREHLHRGRLILSKECPTMALHPSTQVELMRFSMIDGSLDSCVRRWLHIAHTPQRFAPGLVGYTSAYDGSNLSFSTVNKSLVNLAQLLSQVDLGDCIPLFELGSSWSEVGDWQNPDATRFPDGLASIADNIHAAGMIAGIWFAPFVASRSSRLVKDHPAWLLKDTNEQPISVSSPVGHVLVLDTLNAEVRAYVADAIHSFVEAGFGLVEADLLYVAALMPHGGKNRGELMADALDLLRDACGPTVFLSAASTPLAAAFGTADYCRVSPERASGWDGSFALKRRDCEHPSTKNATLTASARRPLDIRAFRNRPAPFTLLDDTLKPEQLTAMLQAQLSSGAFLTSDDVSAWSEAQKARYLEELDTFVQANNFNHTKLQAVSSGKY